MNPDTSGFSVEALRRGGGGSSQELVKEDTALRKLKPMFHEAHVDPAARLPGQDTGEFHLLRGKEVIALRSRSSLIRTEQLPEERILELARSAKS